MCADTCCGGVFPTKLHCPHLCPRDGRGHVQHSLCVLLQYIAHDVHRIHRVLDPLHVIGHWNWHRKGSGTLHLEGRLLFLHSNAEFGNVCIVIDWWIGLHRAEVVAVCSLVVKRVERA